ncbi:MAG: hypothetical protein FIA91_06095 [Geobacter sp.]|nr:hypothetical protein [Geobacter sp.]
MTKSADRGDRRDLEYPPQLAEAELAALCERRKLAGTGSSMEKDEPWAQDGVGLALSGGGIRSATIGLGLVQGVARLGLLPRIDLISTVSGGGYLGSFLGRLIQSKGEVMTDPTPPVHQAAKDLATGEDGPSFPLRWLRENGFYLAPNGSGDEGVMAAITLRNWAAIWSVMSLFLLTLMLLLNGLRLVVVPMVFGGIASLMSSPELANDTCSMLRMLLPPPWPLLGDHFWWSPWCVIPIPVLLLGVLPPGILYWIQPSSHDVRLRLKLLSLALIMPVTGLLLLFLASCQLLNNWLYWVEISAGASFVAMGLYQSRARYEARRITPESDGLVSQIRWQFSHQLHNGLRLLALAVAVALGDTASQTIYAVVMEGGLNALEIWAGGIATALVVLVPLSRKALNLLPSGKEKVKLPVTLITWVAAILLALTVLLTLGTATQAITWGFKRPQEPGQTQTAGSLLLRSASLKNANISVRLKDVPTRATLDKTVTRDTTEVMVSLPAEQNLLLEVNPAAAGNDAGVSSSSSTSLFISLALAAFLSLICGRHLSFLNRSSLATFYQNRLARTFLGASNPLRQNGNTSVREVMPGDDILWTDYKPHAFGGPLHIVNVTINETVDGKSQVQQRDRKGLGMAVGPCGISVGVRHHAYWGSPVLSGLPIQQGYAVFPAKGFKPENLTLSQWMGISGAAVNTAMGSYTSLGLSLLCGLFNVRLGYWWDSGRRRREKGWLGWLSLGFPVQGRMVNELLAMFPGTAARLWFLSDGGHFENSGIYEMARRRVRYIIYSDAGADADYTFADLANLTLKLRADFGAELEFFTPEEMEKINHPALVSWDRLKPDPQTGTMPGHGTLARVRYPEGGESLVIVLKPGLTGDEPLDLRYYKTGHPDFPHQSTMDQFFDEPQWESYRKLGEHMALEIFGKADRAQQPFGWMPE